MAGPVLEIQPPARAARVGGIRTVAEVRPNNRIGNTQEIVFQSPGCAFPQSEVLRCFEEDPVPDKTYSGIEIEDAIGAPFTLFAGVACHVAPDPDELERAERILESGWDRAIEDVLGTWASAGRALPAAADIKAAIGTVDQDLDDKYIGQGVILMSRLDAVLAGDALHVGADGRLTTVNGTPVITSGRVDPGSVNGLGAIVIERSAMSSYQAIDHEKNMHYALAEAQYVLAVDCEFRTVSTVTP